jgi:hypothetical protein
MASVNVDEVESREPLWGFNQAACKLLNGSPLGLEDMAAWKFLCGNGKVVPEAFFHFAMLLTAFPSVDAAEFVTVVHHVLGNPDAAAPLEGTDLKEMSLPRFT